MNLEQIYISAVENLLNDNFHNDPFKHNQFILSNKKEILAILDKAEIQKNTQKLIEFLILKKKYFYAIIYLDLIVMKFPKNYLARFTLAKVCHLANMSKAALLHMQKIPKENHTLEFLQLLSNIYNKIQNFNECIKVLRKIRLLDKVDVTNTIMLLNCYKRLKLFKEAETELITLKNLEVPKVIKFHNEVMLDIAQDKFNIALDKINSKVNEFVEEHLIYQAKAHIFRKLRRFKEALDQIAISKKLNAPNDLSVYGCYFAMNDFSNGYSFLVQATDNDGLTDLLRSNGITLWNGENLDKKQIFILNGEGIALGDQIFFYRYLLNIKEKYDVDIFWCNSSERIKFLFENDGINLININNIKQYIQKNKNSYLTTIPRMAKFFFQKDNSKVINFRKFIKEDNNKSQFWDKYLNEFKKKLRIGINWKGDIRYQLDVHRSINLNILKPIFDVNYIDYFILNNEITENEINFISNFSNVHLIDQKYFISEKQNAFCETIEIIRNLDLVITTDTAIAHLSAALGAKTYVLLEYSPYWYWDNEENENYYQNNKLKYFKQTSAGDWDSVIQAILEKLKF